MTVVSRPASNPALFPFVDLLWWAQRPGMALGQQYLLPSSHAQILISTGSTGNLLVGPKTRRTKIEQSSNAAIIGVSFQSGGLQPFITESTEHVTNLTVGLDSFWKLGSLAGQLAELESHSALDLLEAELIKRLQPELASRHVLACIQAVQNGCSAGKVAHLFGLDRRSLVPEFRRVVGVGPKHFERLERFGQTLRAIRKSQPNSLARIATELGYSDQAHLSREFSEFSGLRPSALLGSSTTSPNHVDI